MTWATITKYVDHETGEVLVDLRHYDVISKQTEVTQINFKNYVKHITKFCRRKIAEQQKLF